MTERPLLCDSALEDIVSGKFADECTQAVPTHLYMIEAMAEELVAMRRFARKYYANSINPDRVEYAAGLRELDREVCELFRDGD